ncbi:MAG: CHASE domain-containing protein, partial [Proteobacteria bacterium]|nr:CHASE domain-containing protein [Pseudomonadota bacterium]
MNEITQDSLSAGEANVMKGVFRFKFLPWLVLVLGLAATYFLQQAAFDDTRRLQQEDFAYQTHVIVLRIEQRLATYEQVLRGFKGLYAASKSVERDEFRSYADIQHLAEHYPGIQGVGFSLIVPLHEKASHVAALRKEGFPDYRVYPDGERDLYTPIIYLEPFAGSNLRAFGYDMYSEATRRSAMERARDLGKSAMSGKVALVQEAGQKAQAGFLMYLPVYRNGRPHETLAERRANIVGWVYAPFRMNDLMPGILGEQGSSLDYEIFDGEQATPASLMYDSDGHLSLHQDRSLYHISQRLEIIGHTWNISLRSLPAFDKNIDIGRVAVIRMTGALVSVLLSLLVLLLVSGRTRALHLAQDMTVKLRESEARLALTLNSAELGAWDWNIKTGRIVFNERWAQMRGYGCQEVELDGQFLAAGIFPEDIPLLQKKLAEHFKNNSVIFDAEYRVCTKSGAWIWLFGRGTVIERDEKGEPLRMVGIEMDISDRKKTEAELHAAATELQEAHRYLLQSEKMASIGQLAAGVAHEINNPIGYVYSNLGALEKYVQETFAMLDMYEQAEASITDPEVLCRLDCLKRKLDIAFLREDLGSLMNESKEGITRVKQIVQNLKDFSHVDIADEWHFTD